MCTSNYDPALRQAADLVAARETRTYGLGKQRLRAF